MSAVRRLRFAALLLVAALFAPARASVREGTDAPGTPEPAALARLATRVDSLVAAGRVPVVVFDIDGTLTDPSPRTRALFEAYATTHARDRARLRAGLAKVPVERYAYAPESTLARMGVRDTALVRRITKAWADGFFANKYLGRDTPLAGAPAYVDSLWRHGAYVVYLTGRDAPRMLEGTAAALRDRGFPIAHPRAVLVMKPDPKMGDLVFKKAVFDDVARVGPVAGVFENEPANLQAMADRFPDAIAVFVDTTHDPKKTEVVPARAAWVRDFRLP